MGMAYTWLSKKGGVVLKYFPLIGFFCKRSNKSKDTGSQSWYKYPYDDPITRYKLAISSGSEGTYNLVAYAFITIFWGMTTWVLLTYATIIRATMGAEEEEKLLK